MVDVIDLTKIDADQIKVNGIAETVAVSTTPMPSLEQVGSLMVGVRDDVARVMGVPIPENVKLVAVKVIYVVHQEHIDDRKVYTALANRQLVDPFYESVVRDLL